MAECFGSMPAARNSPAISRILRLQLVRLLVHRDRVEVDDAEDALVVVLDLDPVSQGSKVVADVEIAGWLDSGENSCFHARWGGQTPSYNARHSSQSKSWFTEATALPRVDGRVVLTPFVLPGEQASVEPRDQLHARLLHVEQPAPERVEPGCPYFGICGGCHYQHAAMNIKLNRRSRFFAR